MKRLLLILSILYTLPSFSYGQTEILEQYFHELQGMEDSTGVTHLFYRLYESGNGTCAFRDGDGGYESADLTLYDNHIYHFDSASAQDSLLLEDYYSVQGMCGRSVVSVVDLDFRNSNPGEVYSIQLKNFEQVESSTFLYNSKGDPLNISLLTDFYRRIAFDNSSDSLLFTYIDIFSSEYEEITVRISVEDSAWEEGRLQQDYISSSNTLPFQLLAINPFNNHYVGFRNDSLTVSTDNGTTFHNLLLLQTPAGIQNLKKPLFDPDSTTLYLKRKVTDSVMNLDNDFLFRIRLQNDNTIIDTLGIEKMPFFATTDDENSGHLYLSDSTDVLFSDNYGESFSTMFTIEHQITGLYKKPDSDYLYVLTREELLEVNVETGESISLKQLPVSNEQEPEEFPTEISLHQNFPNPFNPTTVIDYQLPESGAVNLEVFDVTGRRVANLVDDQLQNSGTHQVSFDASSLSSGIYFYRLQTSGQTITRKMTVVK